MKKRLIKPFAILCVAVVAFCASSCTLGANYLKHRLATEVQADVAEISPSESRLAGYYGFSAELLSNTKMGDKGSMIAPFPTYTALGMVMQGAKENTLKEAEAVLGGSIDDVNGFVATVKKEIESKSTDTEVSLANSVWINTAQGLDAYIKRSWVDAVARHYEPELYALPFDNSAIRKINNWARKSTDGNIKEVIKSFEPNDTVAIFSSIFIDGKWSTQAKSTKSGTFYALDGREQSAQYFSGKSSLYESKQAYAIRRYLSGYYFMAVQPKDGVSFDALVANFNGAELNALINNVNPRGANYTLPEFENEMDSSLKEPLQKMGLVDAFEETADLTGIIDRPNDLMITDATQTTKIKVDKNGLKAAAVIKISLGAKSEGPLEQPLQLDFDHPFIYAICTSSGVPLFMGTVTAI